MATWRTIASTEVDADSPVTATLMSALSNNPTAIAEGASGAPKIAMKIAQGTGATIDFTSLSTFNGIWLEFYATDSGGSGANITVALSDDGGSTFSAAATVAVIPSGGTWLQGSVFVEFSTGWSNSAYGGATAASTANPTVTTPAGTVDALRLSSSATGTVYLAVLANPNGGRTTT